MIFKSPVQAATDVIVDVVDTCTQACTCCLHNGQSASCPSRKKQAAKVFVMYLAMVAVSTLAIYFLEHATWSGAIRTALVAALAKTVVATWISSFFT